MTVSSFTAARRICQQSDWAVTNLSLHKILYMAHMVYMGRTKGDRLIDGGFEAWDYGPVEPKVYRRTKIFGDRPIQDIFFNAAENIGTEEMAVIDEACRTLLERSPGELVEMTHWDRGAWARNYVPKTRGIRIPEADILAEYEARTGAAQQPL